MSAEDLVEVFKGFRQQAEVVASLLRANNIPVVVFGGSENSGVLVSLVERSRVMVKPGDAELARELVGEE